MHQETMYQAIDLRNTTLIKSTCEEVIIDGVVWYDTTENGFHYEKLYLQHRGLIIIHPVNAFLVRFKEPKKPAQREPEIDHKKALRAK